MILLLYIVLIELYFDHLHENNQFGTAEVLVLLVQ